MNIKIFCVNEKGKIELTKCELEKLLAEAYEEGRHAGCNCKHNEEKPKIEPDVKPVEISKSNKDSQAIVATSPKSNKQIVWDANMNGELGKMIDDIFRDLSKFEPTLYAHTDGRNASNPFMNLGKEVAEL